MMLRIIRIVIFIGSFVSCGDEKVYPSCAHCKKGNDTGTDIWCNGNCVFNDAKSTCEEKGDSM